MRHGLVSIALCILLTTLSAAGVWAHPHVFIDASLEFEMRERTVEGVWIEWTFDPVFSADVIGQFDRNRDKAFDEAESAVVQAKAFSNLAKYGYFTFLRHGDTRFTPEAIENFRASQREGRAVYRFRVPLEGRGFSDDISIAAFDSTFYCAIRNIPGASKATWLGGEPAGTPRFEAVVNKKYPVYYNPAGRTGDTRVYLKWEKGLQTAYPEEIRIRFE
jgi:ABC-type uncharacterized transport system substrate-binding protein